ncbi:hypothetical protein [Aquabacterium sp. OR-4]|uniref:hypothetical protein n=1 Tax=Aquabacterium sp. OR-4 TaxID=2978127 RepID=UPI0021B31F62|nr:hypothetical protein [Aquabacterium sp. OR-4]MDT7838411.1 hypothetical protein [Aquabacterium sp. OR-4]
MPTLASPRPASLRAWLAPLAVAALAVACAWALLRPGVNDGLAPAPASAAPRPPGPGAVVAAALPAPPALAVAVPAAAAAADACPLQSMQLSFGQQAGRRVCMGSTVLQQSGSVRSYLVQAGDAEGWRLRIDLVERRVHAVSLSARDGRAYGCAAPDCPGGVVVSQAAGGAGQLTLRQWPLAPAATARAPVDGAAPAVQLDASLRLPSDEQVPGLACTGPSLSLRSADGAVRRFCGQGGAGVEITDQGLRQYRFHDHEGRTLMVAVNADQRVVAVAWQGLACQGNACSGASTAAAEAGNDLAERSFFFGRTALFDTQAPRQAGTAAVPALIVDGTLVMPAQ